MTIIVPTAGLFEDYKAWLPERDAQAFSFDNKVEVWDQNGVNIFENGNIVLSPKKLPQRYTFVFSGRKTKGSRPTILMEIYTKGNKKKGERCILYYDDSDQFEFKLRLKAKTYTPDYLEVLRLTALDEEGGELGRKEIKLKLVRPE